MNTPMTPADRNRLRFNVLLEPLSDEEFAALESRLTERCYIPEQVIIEDNTHGDELYFLLQGRVRISKQALNGDDQVLAILHPGDCFGELELIAGRPRSARVVAVDSVIAYALHRTDFERLLETSNAFANRLLQVLTIRVRAMNYHFIRETNRKIERSQREIRKFEQLIEATKRLNSTLDLEKLLDIILEMALKIVDGDRGTVYLLDETHRELWTKVATGLDGSGRETLRLPLGKGIAGYVAATGDTINIPDAYMDPRFNPEVDRQTGYRTESILCMPMRNKDGGIIGVFQLLNKKRGVFTEDDATFIDALSVHASLAIENARLYESERRKIRIERDLLAAREVQMSLLPKQLPQVEGYEFAASTAPALEVAGDLYDFIALDDKRLAVCLGDVSGKGLPASLLMANIQATLRDQAHATASAVECVRKTNRLLYESTSSEKFVTLVYGLLECSTHRFSYCNAGHDEPILVKHDGSLRRLNVGGVVLGIMQEFPFEEDAVPLEEGDVLVVYSDGIAEAVNPAGEQFGAARVEHLVRELRGHPAAAIERAILAAVRSHIGQGTPEDDMTIVIVKRSRTGSISMISEKQRGDIS